MYLMTLKRVRYGSQSTDSPTAHLRWMSEKVETCCLARHYNLIKQLVCIDTLQWRRKMGGSWGGPPIIFFGYNLKLISHTNSNKLHITSPGALLYQHTFLHHCFVIVFQSSLKLHFIVLPGFEHAHIT